MSSRKNVCVWERERYFAANIAISWLASFNVLPEGAFWLVKLHIVPVVLVAVLPISTFRRR